MSLVEEVVEIAKEAGEILKTYFKNNVGVSYKSDNSPVTEADIASHNYIVDKLRSISNYSIVTEENADDFNADKKIPDIFWLVDPLDGTKQFIKNQNEFCVSISLIKNARPVLGVIYAPILQELYYADEDSGFNTNQKMITSKEFKILVSNEKAKRLHKEIFAMFGDPEISLVKSAIKYGRIASGKYDFYFRSYGSYKWDISSGDIILQQAGYLMLELNGKLIDYSNPFVKNKGFVIMRKNMIERLPDIFKCIRDNNLA